MIERSGAHALDLDRSSRDLSSYRQQLRYAGAVAVLIGDISVGAVVIELAARIRRLQCRKLYVLIFNAHFEIVFAVDLRKVICDLERLADFVRRQEVITA